MGTRKVRPLRKDIPEDLKKNGPDTFRDTVPRLMLWRRYEAESKRWKSRYKRVLCTFESTERAIRKQKVDLDADTDLTSMIGERIFGFERKTVEETITSRREDRTIMGAILFRLWGAHKGMQSRRKKGDRKNEFRWQLFIDTHLDMCTYMLAYGMFDDEDLTDPDRNKINDIFPARKEHYPHDTRFNYCGELPDLTMCLDQGNLWYDVRPRGDDIVSVVVHALICKPQNQKCQTRNFIEILVRYFKKHPVLVSLFRLLAETSLMGNYDHCRYRPQFERRIGIRGGFNMFRIDDQHFYQWLVEKDQLAYYVTKEFYIYTVSQQYALEVTFQKLQPQSWPFVKASIIGSMDVARSILCRSVMDERCFSLIESELVDSHAKTLPYITKLRKGNFLDVILSEMNKFHEKNMALKNSAASQTTETYITDELKRWIEMCARKEAPRLDNRVSIRWLKCLGVTKNGYDLIKNLYYEYERLDIADNAIAKKLSVIARESLSDFHICRHYFRVIDEIRSVRQYKLTWDYANNQRLALRTKLCLPPWEELPDDADLFYYCPSCKCWANPVVDSTSAKGKMNVYARGFEKVLYDHETDELYCGRQTPSNTVKKIIEHNPKPIEGTPDMDSKSAKIMRRHNENMACRDTKLMPVNMLGIIQKLDGKQWILCESCAGLIEFTASKFNRQGSTCNYHRREHTRNPTESAKIEKKLKPGMGVLEMARLESGITEEATVERCWYCETDRITAMRDQEHQPAVVRILEDRDGQLKVETVMMCWKDYDLVKDMFWGNSIASAMNVARLIKARRFNRMIGPHI